MFFSHGAAALGVAAGAEAAQELGFEVDLLGGRGSREGAGVGVDSGKSDTGHVAVGEQFQDAGAGVADANDFNGQVFPGSRGGQVLGDGVHGGNPRFQLRLKN